MAPARGRAVEDPKVESTSVKDRVSSYSSAVPKPRKGNGAALSTTTSKEDVPPYTTAALQTNGNSNGGGLSNANGVQNGVAGLNWLDEDASLLRAYRTGYRLDVSTPFDDALTAAVLTTPGIGQNSPTMVKRRSKKKISKEQLATSVRRHFNSLAVTEGDVVVDFLYKVKYQDQALKLRFAPRQHR